MLYSYNIMTTISTLVTSEVVATICKLATMRKLIPEFTFRMPGAATHLLGGTYS